VRTCRLWGEPRPLACSTRGSRRSRRASPCSGTWDPGGQALACSLGRRRGDVLRRDIFAPRPRGKGSGERPRGRAGLRITPLVEAEYKLEATAADPVAAQALQVSAGSPIFLIERTSYTTSNRPVEYERLHRGDPIRFVTRLARRPRTSTQTGGAQHECRLWLFAMSLDGRLGVPMRVESIGIAIAAFHIREVAFAAASRGARSFSRSGEVRHDTERCAACPWG
jgi:hypothetical protein